MVSSMAGRTERSERSCFSAPARIVRSIEQGTRSVRRRVPLAVEPDPQGDEEAGDEADAICRTPDADSADQEQLDVREIALEHDAGERQRVVRRQQRDRA